MSCSWQGIVSVDREKLEVTVRAGTTLSELNILLEKYGLAMRILGSISDQTVGGAISTGEYHHSKLPRLRSFGYLLAHDPLSSLALASYPGSFSSSSKGLGTRLHWPMHAPDL